MTFALQTVLLLLSLAGAVHAAPMNPAAPLEADAGAPRFDRIKCPDGITASACGYVTVPENRKQPRRQVRLFTMLIRSSRRKHAPEPLFFLTGGPGEKSTRFLALAQHYPNHDFVTFDQRGVGYSKPELECQAYIDVVAGHQAVFEIDGQLGERLYAALRGCGQRFRAQGIDLGSYNASESAADIEAIRQALGYAKINLLGVSYGTRLAQEYMRRWPRQLRAVILDSVIPPESDRPAMTPRSAEASLQNVFAACAADPDCNESYPRLPQLYTEVLTRLNRRSESLQLGRRQVKINGNGLQALIFLSLYNPQWIAELPQVIHGLKTRDMRILNRSTILALRAGAPTALTWAAFFATECNGEVAFSDPQALEQSYREFPHWKQVLGMGPGISSPGIYQLCRDWGLNQPVASENQPISSDLPTLLMTGQFDPVTPPAQLEQVASRLTQAYSFVLPGQSHAVSISNRCGLSLVQSFLRNPAEAPDATCIDRLKPEFR